VTGKGNRRDRTRRGAGRGIRTGLAAAALGLTMLTAGMGSAQASSQTTAATSAVVVKVAVRGAFGKILTADNGHALYTHPGGPCTGSCLSVWPALLMPRGKTVPKGASCLTTKKFTGARLQVAYNKQVLYTFVNDTATSVNGNGVGGFMVAKVTAACP
jgi:predicted lipoprotein with Yx(FWY)xxD motif